MKLTRRDFLERAASFGAVLAWPSAASGSPKHGWREHREYYPQGVASGDPDPGSVILWTRRPPVQKNTAAHLTVEVAEDSAFRRIISRAKAEISADNDWTCRVLAAGLKRSHVYWYRFTDEQGFGSRVGRTVTAPSIDDSRQVRFAFVSCQNVQQGACNAYRRMIWEDRRRPAAEQLGFVLHLGDFVYEVVWYPEDRPQGMYSRRLRDIVRYESGEKIRDFHIPVTVDDYRSLYRAYLLDPDLQDARARWPFICMWDNHEFSWRGWQSQQNFDGVRPAQTRKVAASQAWFEYQPARVVRANSTIDRFEAPKVADTQIVRFDESGLGLEPGNLAAIDALKLYRSFRWGRNIDLILTDNRSFRSEPVTDQKLSAPFQPKKFPFVVSQDVLAVLDAGRMYDGGKPPEGIRFDDEELPNPRRNASPQSMLGSHQKAWLLQKLRESKATWKLWGNSVAMLDWRLDLQNLPDNISLKWPATGYAQMVGEDWSGYRFERAEILGLLTREGITGLASLAGDRHSFQAGLLSESLPPLNYDPVAIEFVTGSVSAPGLFEAVEYNLPKDHPLRPIYLYDSGPGKRVYPAMNLSFKHGVRSSLILSKTGDIKQALMESNRDLAPHLSFLDAGGHGYSVVTVSADELEVEFVCIPRPIESNKSADGGPLAYRVAHRVKRWHAGQPPRIERTLSQGALPLIL
jgi:alkaline phosphatase D